MAYVPPHKRHSKHKDGPLPSPELPPPQRNKNSSFKSSNSHAERSRKIVYAKQAISKWFAIGLDHNNQPPSSVHLQPISLEHVERKIGGKSLILVMDPQPLPQGQKCASIILYAFWLMFYKILIFKVKFKVRDVIFSYSLCLLSYVLQDFKKLSLFMGFRCQS